MNAGLVTGINRGELRRSTGAQRSFNVGDAVRHVPGRDMQPGIGNIVLGIVEKDVGAEGFQERPLRTPAQEQRFIQP